jgi:histidine triad (HIT) family protein
MQGEGCPFCAIAGGRAHADIVYQNREVMAFLPLRLEAYGHTLIATTVHHETLWDLSEHLFTTVLNVAQVLSMNYRARVGATGVNLLHASRRDAQQSVPHFHVHLLPHFHEDGLDSWPRLCEVKVDRTELTAKLRVYQ